MELLRHLIRREEERSSHPRTEFIVLQEVLILENGFNVI